MRRIATQGYRAAATFIDVAIPLRAIPAVFARLPGGRFTAGKATLKILVKWAYELTDDELAGGPKWTDSNRYDIVAKPEGDAETSKPSGTGRSE